MIHIFPVLCLNPNGPRARMLNDIVKELFLFVCITYPSAPMARNENMFAFVREFLLLLFWWITLKLFRRMNEECRVSQYFRISRLTPTSCSDDHEAQMNGSATRWDFPVECQSWSWVFWLSLQCTRHLKFDSAQVSLKFSNLSMKLMQASNLLQCCTEDTSTDESSKTRSFNELNSVKFINFKKPSTLMVIGPSKASHLHAARMSTEAEMHIV